MADEDKDQQDNKDSEDQNNSDQKDDKDSGPKMVKESDLLAVKSQLSDSKSKLTTAEAETVTWQNKFNARNGEFETQSTELESLKTVQETLDELKGKSESDSKTLTETQEGLVARTKDVILARYPNLSSDKLKDKSQQQLDIMLDTLEDVAPSGQKRNDPGPASNNSSGGTALEVAAQELAEAKAR